MINSDLCLTRLADLLKREPDAFSHVRGSEKYSGICGTVRFYRIQCGCFVAYEIKGLPTGNGKCESPVFGFHIHEGGSCTGNAKDPFADTLLHFDKCGCEHPHHSGDMPPLFGNNGCAVSAFFTNRFSVNEVVGRTVVVHAMPDDFTTQPSGGSGEKIACGIIELNRKRKYCN